MIDIAVKEIYSNSKELIEFIEDVGLTNAINECDRNEVAYKQELFDILDAE